MEIPTYLWVNIPSAEFSMIEAQTKTLSMRDCWQSQNTHT
jgi:hypothetical protein